MTGRPRKLESMLSKLPALNCRLQIDLQDTW
jgi:hypothetical protein